MKENLFCGFRVLSILSATLASEPLNGKELKGSNPPRDKGKDVNLCY